MKSTDDRRVTGMPFSTVEFFGAVADEYEGLLPENVPQVRAKPRISSLMSDARVVAYSMANTEKSNPARIDPDKVDSAYTQEQGRLMETPNHRALVRLGQKHGFTVLPTPLCIGHEACENKTAEGAHLDHWATGHPDDIVEMNGELILVSYKHFGRFAYKGLARDGLHKRFDDKGEYTKGMELIAQEVAYGAGMVRRPARVWWVVIAQDASSMRLEFKQKAFIGKDPHPKGWLRSADWEDIDYFEPTLRARAEWFSAWFTTDGNPAHVAMEKPIVENWRDLPAGEVFPWGYSEYEDRALADGQGHLIAPRALPF